MNKIANFISSYIAVIVLFVAALALFVPSSFSWMKPSCISWMLGVVMCGMGLNLKLDDFRVVFSRPKDVIIGCLAQFIIMPFLAWTLCKVFGLSPELAIGVILVGCCPGGTSSNVITFLAKGDLALSVGMTGVSTLLAPFLTPLLTYLLAGQSVDVDMVRMFLDIVQVVILPIVIGLLISHYLPKLTEAVKPYLPAISTIAIALIVGCIFAANSARVMESSLIIIVVVMLHNVCGYLLGFSIGKVLGLSKPKRTAIAVEVGMQNSGLATSLASSPVFAMYPLATVPGAIFSVWHNFSGAILASILKREASIPVLSRNDGAGALVEEDYENLKISNN